MLVFELRMPNVGSWDGKWSGEGNYFAVVKKVGKKKEEELDGKRFIYDFGDGWTVLIYVRKVSVSEGNRLRKKSKGFCGYEWMVRSIIERGCIDSDVD